MEIRALMSAMWRNRTGPLLVAAQVALTLAAVVNVAYIVQQRVTTANQPTGMDMENIFSISTRALSPSFNYAAAVQADIAWLRSLPGVVSASTSSALPQTWNSMGLPFAADVATLQKPNGGESGRIYFGDEKYLDTLGLKLLAGRTFDRNAVAPPSADFGAAFSAWPAESIVTQALAKKLFPNGDALGKTMHVGLVNKSTTIVGIVEYMQGQPSPKKFEQFSIQIVIAPIIRPGPGGLYMVRTQPGQRDALMARVEKEFADREPGRFVERIEAFSETAERTRHGMRASATVLAVVALLVLAVTVIGIAGLAVFNVTTRTKQLGTRRAIGARKFHILRYFLVENWLITTTGCVVGCALALAVGIKLSQSYQMERLPLYYLVGGVLGAWLLGLLSVFIPARRAASIPPATATRMV